MLNCATDLTNDKVAEKLNVTRTGPLASGVNAFVYAVWKVCWTSRGRVLPDP